MSRHTKPASTAVHSTADAEQDLATATEAADLQSHHSWLLCLEQSRQADFRLMRDWLEDGFVAARRIAQARAPGDFVAAQAELFAATLSHGTSAQVRLMSAWSDLYAACSEDLRLNVEQASPWRWAFGTVASGVDTVSVPDITPVWFDGAITTFQSLVDSWSGAVSRTTETTT